MNPPVPHSWEPVVTSELVPHAPGRTLEERKAWINRWRTSAKSASQVCGAVPPKGAGTPSGPRGWQAHSLELGPCAGRVVAYRSEGSCFRNCVRNWVDRCVPRLAGNDDLSKGLFDLEQPDAPSSGASEECDELEAPLRALRHENDFINFCRSHTKAYGIGASKVKTAGGGEEAWHEHFMSFLFAPATRGAFVVCVGDHCLLFLATGDPETAVICESAPYCDRPLHYTREALNSLSLGGGWRITAVVPLVDLQAPTTGGGGGPSTGGGGGGAGGRKRRRNRKRRRGGRGGTEGRRCRAKGRSETHSPVRDAVSGPTRGPDGAPIT